jgi:hypothetical protein
MHNKTNKKPLQHVAQNKNQQHIHQQTTTKQKENNTIQQPTIVESVEMSSQQHKRLSEAEDE